MSKEQVQKNILMGKPHVFKSEEQMKAEREAKLKIKEEKNATKKISE